MIKTIIFDLGRVLVDFNHLTAADKISKLCKNSPQEIFDLFFDSRLTADFESGKIKPLEFFSGVKNILKIDIGYEEFKQIWNDIFFRTERNIETYELARYLRSNYRLAMLSNINVLHFEYLKTRFPIFEAFHDLMLSYELGLRKPDPRIYKKAIEIVAASYPHEIFYTDDRPELIESASLLGIKSFVFENTEKLKSDLASCGVVV